MEVLHPRCAGLDVHKDTVVAAIRCVSAPTHQEVRSFPTTTAGLFALAEWLTSHLQKVPLRFPLAALGRAGRIAHRS